ncbi:hypothetical protein [Ulvibacter litoralis]|uniref:Lipocalin-like domain-containing protein n=1 Tax=Ulvibacter litoralis TaxID=227084 RepID=A0A1G7BUY8_9FLAO|nr:hypothetical protein [Ulvibacter litoralis]GHC49678.1 hypothetical protein GCM10008083_11570 [Ulvibacter litoralis]SDE30823.1 hypothetical protein SAMN05421855_10129 [Ulvibacter litoralis]
MKTVQLLKMMVFTLIVAAFIVACDSDDDSNPTDNAITVAQVTTTASSGDWRITYFYDTDQDETGNYSGYSFTFNQDGTLVAVNESTTVTGTWSISDDSSSSDDDGNNSSDLDFNIFFAAPDDFNELSDDWDIISVSENKIELIDVSGGNGGTDYLTFEKN